MSAQPKTVEVRSNAGSRSGCVGRSSGGVQVSIFPVSSFTSQVASFKFTLQTLIVPSQRVNETTFATNSPAESENMVEEEEESSGVSGNPTPEAAASGRSPPLVAVNGSAISAPAAPGGPGGHGGHGGGGARCASPGCPHGRHGSRNGFHSRGSQTEARKKSATTEQVRAGTSKAGPNLLSKITADGKEVTPTNSLITFA